MSHFIVILILIMTDFLLRYVHGEVSERFIFAEPTANGVADPKLPTSSLNLINQVDVFDFSKCFMGPNRPKN